MELVSGIPIVEYADRNRLPLERRLRLLQQVCEGVQHAHQHGIIHRDLKSGNILVTEQGGKPAGAIIRSKRSFTTGTQRESSWSDSARTTQMWPSRSTTSRFTRLVSAISKRPPDPSDERWILRTAFRVGTIPRPLP